MGIGGQDRFLGEFIGEGDAFYLVFDLVAEDIIALGDIISARHNRDGIGYLGKCKNALANTYNDKLRKMGAVVFLLDGGMKHAVFNVIIYHCRGDKRLVVVAENFKIFANEAYNLIDIKLERGKFLPPRKL